MRFGLLTFLTQTAAADLFSPYLSLKNPLIFPQQLFSHTPINKCTRRKADNQIPGACTVNLKGRQDKPIHAPAQMNAVRHNLYLQTDKCNSRHQPCPVPPWTFPKNIRHSDKNEKIGQDTID